MYWLNQAKVVNAAAGLNKAVNKMVPVGADVAAVDLKADSARDKVAQEDEAGQVVK